MDPATAQILGEEIDKSLKDSWNDGYKSARVEYEPQLDYWMAIATAPVPDRFWEGVLWGGVPGVTVGLVFGGTVVLILSKAVR